MTSYSRPSARQSDGGPPVWRLRASGAIACALVSLIVFWPVTRCDFIRQWDDAGVLLSNHDYRGLGWTQLRWMFTTARFPSFYIPFTWLSYGATYVAFGMNPVGYHLASLLFHAANAALAFLLFAELIDAAQGSQGGLRPRPRTICAAAGALAWALHPLRVEPVAFLAAHGYLVTTTFILCSFVLHLRSRRADAGPRARKLFAASIAAYAVALLSYPLGMTSFLAMLAIDFYPLRRWNPARDRFGPATLRVLIEKIPYLAIAGCMLAATLVTRAASKVLTPSPSLAEFGIASRLMQAAYACARYALHPLWPFGLEPIPTRLLSFSPWEPIFLASAALVIGLSVGAAFAARKLPAAAALWAAHIGVALPALGLTLHPHFASDRYTYIVGLVWGAAASAAMAWALGRARAADQRRAAHVLAIGLGVALASLSIRQTSVWRDSRSYFEYTIKMLGGHPYSADIYPRLAQIYLDEGDTARVSEAVAAALRINPKSAPALLLDGALRFMSGDNAAALKSFSGALESNPNYTQALLARGNLFSDLGRFEEATRDYDAAMKADPLNADARLYAGFALDRMGRASEAEARYREALRLNPALPLARLNLGVLLVEAGRFAEGAEQAREAARLDPGLAAAHNTLGTALAAMERFEEAIPSFEKAIQLDPALQSARDNLRLARERAGSRK